MNMKKKNKTKSTKTSKGKNQKTTRRKIKEKWYQDAAPIEVIAWANAELRKYMNSETGQHQHRHDIRIEIGEYPYVVLSECTFQILWNTIPPCALSKGRLLDSLEWLGKYITQAAKSLKRRRLHHNYEEMDIPSRGMDRAKELYEADAKANYDAYVSSALTPTYDKE